VRTLIERFAGRFALLQPLGTGGMGEVFLARDLATGRECALKRIPRGLASPDPAALRREFAILAGIRHPDVVEFRDFGVSPDGRPWLTMEFVPGLPADHALAPGDWASFYSVGAHVLSGLEALHGANIVHGDLKPSNVLVIAGDPPDGIPAGVRLLDFGLAKLLDERRPGHRGTPGFAAPEVVRGDAPSPASDAYSLGALFYRLVTGRSAFEGATHSTVLRRQLGSPPAQPLEESGASPALVTLVLRLLARDPAERPPSIRAIREEFEPLHQAARRGIEDRLRTTQVVGRDREFGRLARARARAQRAARLVLLEGPAGAGKSAVLDAWGARCVGDGHPSFALSCASHRHGRELIEALLARLTASAPAEEPSGNPLDRSVAAAGDALRALGEKGPAPVVLLDDAERLDAAGHAFLRRMVAHERAPRALWVLARRPLPEDDDAETLLLEQAGTAERIAVDPLDRDGLARLVAARLQGVPPRALEEFVRARSRGHPGLAIQSLRAAAAAGLIREDASGIRVDESALPRVSFAAAFEASLVEPLERMPAAARAAAIALAVWDGPLDAPTMRALAPQADAGAVEVLERAGLARRDADGTTRLSPPALASAILATLPAADRVAWHGSALEIGGLPALQRFHHLAAMGAADAALAAADAALAIHPDPAVAIRAAAIAEAGPAERSALWHLRAGRLLQEQGRHASAIPHFERAVERVGAGEARDEALERLLGTLQIAGRGADAERVLSTIDLAAVPAHRRPRLWIAHAMVARDHGRPEEAERHLAAAMDVAEEAGDPVAWAAAAGFLAARWWHADRFADAEALAARAVDRLESQPPCIERVRARALQAEAVRAQRGVAEAEPLYREAMSMSHAMPSTAGVEDAALVWGNALVDVGQWRNAGAAFADAHRAATEGGRAASATSALTNRAQVEALTGQPRIALRHARTALEMTHRYLPRNAAYALRTLALASRQLGAAARAERYAHQGEWSLVELGRTYASDGRWREIRALLDRPEIRTPPAFSVARMALLAFAGRAGLRLGDHAGAESDLETMRRMSRGRDAPYARALIEQLRAEFLLVTDPTAAAVDAAERALAMFADLPFPWERAQAALEFARLAMGSGHGAAIDPWLETAIAGFGQLGDRRSRERGHALWVQWLRRDGAGGEPQRPQRDLIGAVSRLLRSMHDLDVLANRAMILAVEQLGAERGILLLVNSETGDVEPIAEHGGVDAATRREATTFSRNVVRKVMRGDGAVLVSDAPTDPEIQSQSVTDLGLRSIVCVPMHARGRVIGAVYLDDARRPDAFGDEERRVLEGFAELLAIAIDTGRDQDAVRRANARLEEENRSLLREAGTRFQPHGLIGSSAAMQGVMAYVNHAQRNEAPVLITGENGTGKELIARILHRGGRRRSAPFVAVNCGAIPESLIESELFGHERGAFTGAVQARRGRFEAANGGTLLLDEIGEMPLHQQVRLLRVLSSGEVTPIGGNRIVPVDVRIIAATNRDLRQRVADGTFREDLYYRLAVIVIDVPPLRDRKADIPVLANHFIQALCQQQDRTAPVPSPEFMAALMQSDWPGNVRGLRNYVERVLAMNQGPILYPDPPPPDLEGAVGIVKRSRRSGLRSTVEDLERQLIQRALVRTGGNQSRAAHDLGIKEQTLRYKLERLGLLAARKKSRARRAGDSRL
jgi:Nif-specific regulatory protein